MFIPYMVSVSGLPHNVINICLVDKYRDRESQKLNVIFHNVPESTSTDIAKRISHDTDAVLDITNKIGAEPVGVSTVACLGKK